MKLNKTKRRAKRFKRRSLRRVGGGVLTKKYTDKSVTADFINTKKNIINGNATIVFDSGETYEGPCNSNLNPHGRGTMTFPDGTVYTGEFNDGNKSGVGTINYADGHTYAGPCNSNLNPHGRGTMTFPDGTVFVGEFNDGNKSGVGTINYADGAIYEGEFAEDAPHGRGKYTTPKGVYEGHLHYGHKQGLGKMTFVNGDVYEGNFNEDRIEGPGILTKPDGTVVYEGNFRETKEGIYRVIEQEDQMPPMVPHPDYLYFNPAQAAAVHAQSLADMEAHNLTVRRAQIAANVAAAREKQLRQKEALAAIRRGEYAHAPPSVVAARLGFGK